MKPDLRVISADIEAAAKKEVALVRKSAKPWMMQHPYATLAVGIAVGVILLALFAKLF